MAFVGGLHVRVVVPNVTIALDLPTHNASNAVLVDSMMELGVLIVIQLARFAMEYQAVNVIIVFRTDICLMVPAFRVTILLSEARNILDNAFILANLENTCIQMAPVIPHVIHD